jgi:hypothetical protein
LGGGMDTKKPETKIIRIDSNFSSSPNHSLCYDVSRKSLIITNIDKPVELKDRRITITISLSIKLD